MLSNPTMDDSPPLSPFQQACTCIAPTPSGLQAARSRLDSQPWSGEKEGERERVKEEGVLSVCREWEGRG